MRKFLPILGLLILAGRAFAAVPVPGTDIWVADIRVTPDAIRAIGARNVTNRPGYDNQPAFITPHSLLFTSMDATGQTDAWRYDLESGRAAPLLSTPESEYSPTVAPQGSVSVVRVALSGVQQLWLLAPGAQTYEVLFPMLEGVGYHAWLDAAHVALFLVREPAELHIANRDSGEVAVLAKDIGRSLQPVPGQPGSIAFTEPGQDGKRWIKRLDFAARRIVPLAPVLAGSEDFVFLPDGRLLMAKERGLFMSQGNDWHEIARFDALPGNITRLAVSPDATRLAMVVGEGE